MLYEYVEVIIQLEKEVLGKVRFQKGEGDQSHYIRRAKILSRPYLGPSEKELNFIFKVTMLSSTETKLLETFIPVIR